jgi:hypothetical protein
MATLADAHANPGPTPWFPRRSRRRFAGETWEDLRPRRLARWLHQVSWLCPRSSSMRPAAALELEPTWSGAREEEADNAGQEGADACCISGQATRVLRYQRWREILY